MRKILFTIALLCPALFASAQMDFNTQAIKEKYPDADAYYLTDKATLNIDIKGGELEITSDYSSDMLLLNDKASMFSRKSIYYYQENEVISELKAHSYIPQDNGKLKKIEVEKTFTHNPMKDNVFYDDLQEIYFDYPSLKQGAVASYSYREKYKDPHFIAPFYLANYSPTGHSEFSVNFPKEVSLKYVLKGDTSKVVFSKKETKNDITYTWKVNDQDSYDEEQEEGNYRVYAPHVILYVDKFTANNKTTPVLSDVSHLYKWYYSHIGELVDVKSNVIQQLADSLTKGVTNEQEKIKKIYYWVQDNIQYIAFEYGLGGYVPRSAELICTRRYGDCKDKSSLIYALLKAAGVKSYFTWIGTRDIPYTYAEVPTPITDNHMIISVRENNKWKFLDGTANGLLYGYPSGFIQDKEALISIAPDSFVVTKVPIVEKEKNFRCDSANVSFDGSTLFGTGQTTFGGYWKYDIYNSFYNISEKEREEKLQDFFEYSNNKCKIDSITYDEGVTSFLDTAKFNYHLSIPSYSRVVDKKVYVNMHLKKFLQGDIVEIEKRKTEERYKYKYVSRQITVLNVPDNYKISKIPSSSKYDGKNFGFKISYKSEGNKIVMEKEISFDELLKMKEQFPEWNKMINQLDDAYTEVVVLEKNQ